MPDLPERESGRKPSRQNPSRQKPRRTRNAGNPDGPRDAGASGKPRDAPPHGAQDIRGTQEPPGPQGAAGTQDLTGTQILRAPRTPHETDAERRRRRAQFLRDLAEARELRDRVQPRRAKVARLRHAMRMRTFRW
ncbi:response regulator [Streptomyces griseorubiginosus]|uniref:response regulator n=1 Tax=Streptomyces griseorubiginosus TaxID=67304 RepID=UPI0033CC3B33